MATKHQINRGRPNVPDDPKYGRMFAISVCRVDGALVQGHKCKDQARAAVRGMNALLAERDGLLDKVARELDEARRSAAKRKARVEQLTEQVRALRTDLSATQRERDEVRDGHADTVDGLVADVDKQRAEKRRAVERLREFEAAAKRVVRSEARADRIAELERALHDERKSHRRSVDRLEAERDRARAELDSTIAVNVELREQLKAMTNRASLEAMREQARAATAEQAAAQ